MVQERLWKYFRLAVAQRRTGTARGRTSANANTSSEVLNGYYLTTRALRQCAGQAVSMIAKEYKDTVKLFTCHDVEGEGKDRQKQTFHLVQLQMKTATNRKKRTR